MSPTRRSSTRRRAPGRDRGILCREAHQRPLVSQEIYIARASPLSSWALDRTSRCREEGHLRRARRPLRGRLPRAARAPNPEAAAPAPAPPRTTEEQSWEDDARKMLDEVKDLAAGKLGRSGLIRFHLSSYQKSCPYQILPRRRGLAVRCRRHRRRLDQHDLGM